MQDYVAGLMFRHSPSGGNSTEVALVLKNKPAFQKGKLNAIGGKVETGEGFITAMVREFREETGCVTVPEDWRQFCVLRGHDWCVCFFSCHTGAGRELKTMETELISWIPVHSLWRTPEIPDTLPNLRWLVPMAMDKDNITAVVEDYSNF